MIHVFSFIFLFSLTTTAETKIVFEKQKIRIGDKTLKVEIAKTNEQHALGLMYRKKLDDGTGMLFIFDDMQVRQFWMKNTFIALSIGYFDNQKKLVDIQDMEPVASEMEVNPKTYVSKSPAQFALEVPQGWFKKNRINIGTKFQFIR